MTMKLFEIYIDEIIDVWGGKILAAMDGEEEYTDNELGRQQFKEWLLSDYDLESVFGNTEEGTLIMVRNDVRDRWLIRTYVGIMNGLVWCYDPEDGEYQTAHSWKMARLK